MENPKGGVDSTQPTMSQGIQKTLKVQPGTEAEPPSYEEVINSQQFRNEYHTFQPHLHEFTQSTYVPAPPPPSFTNDAQPQIIHVLSSKLL